MFEPLDAIEFSPERDESNRRALVHYAATHRRRRRGLFVLPAAALLGALTAGTIALLWPVTNTNGVSCFARAELRGDGTFPGASGMLAEEAGEQIPIDDAVGFCKQMWRDGLLDARTEDGLPRRSPGQPIVPDPERDAPVPALLTVCVLPNGGAAVIPGDDTVCTRVGLPRATEQ